MVSAIAADPTSARVYLGFLFLGDGRIVRLDPFMALPEQRRAAEHAQTAFRAKGTP